MATLPTPLRAVLGLAATALDEARKLPETLPQAPVVAVSTAMQVSLRVQQRIAELAARGDELLSQLRGPSSEPPEWATFDEAPGSAPAGGRGLAAFDRVPDGSAGDPGESAADLGDLADLAASVGEVTEAAKSGKNTKRAGTTSTAKLASAAKPAKAAGSARPAKVSGAKAGSSKAAGSKTTGTRTTSKTTATKATNKPAGAKTTGPAKRTRAGRTSEPLAKAASRARPADPPNPTTMAAEIVQAQQAADSTTTAGPGNE